VPGVAAVSGHVSNAVFQGSVNAFLTLRVAMVAIAYSRATIRPERHVVWRSAIARAGHLVIRTVTVGSADVTKAFAVAAAKTVASGVAGVGHAVATGATNVGHGVITGTTNVGNSVVTAGQAVITGATKAGKAAGNAAKGTGETMASFGTGAVGTVRGAADRLGKRVRRPKVDASDVERADDTPSDAPDAADDSRT
jgi:hypothetical protein